MEIDIRSSEEFVKLADYAVNREFSPCNNDCVCVGDVLCDEEDGVYYGFYQVVELLKTHCVILKQLKCVTEMIDDETFYIRPIFGCYENDINYAGVSKVLSTNDGTKIIVTSPVRDDCEVDLKTFCIFDTKISKHAIVTSVVKIGDRVYTPRFCNVEIERIFKSERDARRNGFTEPTYYEGAFKVYGKSLDMYHMIFAAVI